MPRNKNAGKHPSYKKRGMSKSSIAKKRAYDKEYSSTTKRKKYRAKLNKKNRDSGTYGNGDKKDYDHASKRMVSQKTNRGRNSKNKGTAGDVRARK